MIIETTVDSCYNRMIIREIYYTLRSVYTHIYEEQFLTAREFNLIDPTWVLKNPLTWFLRQLIIQQIQFSIYILCSMITSLHVKRKCVGNAMNNFKFRYLL